MKIHGQRTFTLIELLVVVAIISILASLLLPALSSARARAKSMDCLSRLKQLTTAMSMYSLDHADWIPYRNVGDVRNGTTYLEHLAGYLFNPDIGDLNSDNLTEAATKFFVCPSEYRGSDYMVSYTLNGHRTGSWGDELGVVYSNSGSGTFADGTEYVGRPRKLTSIENTAEMMSMMCSPYIGSFGQTYGDGWCSFHRAPIVNGSLKMSFLHRDSANWAFVDGHVAWMSIDQAIGTGSGWKTSSLVNPFGIWTVNTND